MGGNRRDRRVAILLDTNMLLLIADGINVFEQIEEKLAIKPEYIVLKPVIKELEKLIASNKPSIKRKALFALRIVREYCREADVEVNPNETVDDTLIKYAKKHGAAVATNDKELRRRLREEGIPEIYIREESMRIDIEGLEV
ncbi:MAG: 30S processome protein Utp24 [Desulfurococcales archaeon ex4484_58]|nr:MAG: 30S processome protein Utp24 [Desulfurococcales archaeon ex4484_58]